MASRFTKAKTEQAFFKLGLYGAAGSGKTLTSLLFAEGLAARDGKRIAYVDTERGTDFYAMAIPERVVHPEAFDFDRVVTRSLMETIDAIEGLSTDEHSVVVLDSITHLWEAARETYTGKRGDNGQIPIQAWAAIKKPYKQLMAAFLNGNFHGIICGREGIQMGRDELGEMEVTGTKMKAEGETPHEPHVLGRMTAERERDEKGNVIVGGKYVNRCFFEKDRSGILTGKTIDFPKYATIEPIVHYLVTGGPQGSVGTLEGATEKDVELIAAKKAREDKEQQDLADSIRDSINNAKDVDALKAAWSLTTGKKTKLGEHFDKLAVLKDAKKAELLGRVA